jgi:hypothetical protein
MHTKIKNTFWAIPFFFILIIACNTAHKDATSDDINERVGTTEGLLGNDCQRQFTSLTDSTAKKICLEMINVMKQNKVFDIDNRVSDNTIIIFNNSRSRMFWNSLSLNVMNLIDSIKPPISTKEFCDHFNVYENRLCSSDISGKLSIYNDGVWRLGRNQPTEGYNTIIVHLNHLFMSDDCKLYGYLFCAPYCYNEEFVFSFQNGTWVLTSHGKIGDC